MTAALALHVLLMMLGAGLGLSIFSPLTEENPVADFSISTLVIHSICAIVSLYFGGWVAGRFSPVNARSTGWLHGFSVWCAATVGGVILVALGAGVMLGGLSKVVGKSTAAVASNATDLAADAMKRSDATLTSFVDEAVNKLPADGPSNRSIRAKREIGIAVARFFNPAQGEANTEANRAALVTALQDHAGMSQADADLSVTEWTNSYERLEADLATVKEAAETKAREAADVASDAVAKFSLWAFVAFLIGLLAATWGGKVGAVCATRCEELTNEQAYVPTQNA
ncbi:MAG: hypothetical protein V4727_02035 [Verrucomicrobiota bacterium]